MQDTVLIIRDKEVRQVLTMDVTLAALESSFRELGEGSGLNRTRTHTYLPTSQEGVAFRYKTFEGGLTKAGYYGMRIFHDRLSYPTISGEQRQVKHYRDDKYANGLAVVTDMVQNRLVALIADGWLSLLRVGGTSALGTRHLARTDATRVGLLGSGWQARGLAMGLACIRPLESIKVYSPNKSHCDLFSADMSKFLSIAVETADSPDAAMADVDIVATATNSMGAVVKAEWLKPGVHVVAGAHACEVGDAVLSKADQGVIAQHDIGMEFRNEEIEDGRKSRKYVLQGEFEKQREAALQKMGLLSDLVVGKIPGRQGAEEITLMINNFGLGTQFAALGGKVYELARQHRMGFEIPCEYLLSEYRWEG